MPLKILRSIDQVFWRISLNWNLSGSFSLRLGWWVIGRLWGFFFVVFSTLIGVWWYLVWIFIFLVTVFHIYYFSIYLSVFLLSCLTIYPTINYIFFIFYIEMSVYIGLLHINWVFKKIIYFWVNCIFWYLSFIWYIPWKSFLLACGLSVHFLSLFFLSF